MKALLDEAKLPWLDAVVAIREPNKWQWEILFESKCEFDQDRCIVAQSDSDQACPVMIGTMWGHVHLTPCEAIDWIISMRTEELVEITFIQDEESCGGTYEYSSSLSEQELTTRTREFFQSLNSTRNGKEITVAVSSWKGTYDTVLQVRI